MQANGSDEGLKAGAPGGIGAGLAKIVIDDDNLILRPAQRVGMPGELILQVLAFKVLGDLLH
jgi:hypothetical protein